MLSRSPGPDASPCCGGVPGSQPSPGAGGWRGAGGEVGTGLKHPIRPHTGPELGGDQEPPQDAPHAPPATLQTGFGGRDAAPAAGTGRSPPSQICSVPAAPNQVLPDPRCALSAARCRHRSSQIPPRKMRKKKGKKKKKRVGTLQVLEEGSGDGNGSTAPRALVARPSSRVEGSGAGGCVLLPCALVLQSIPWEEEGGPGWQRGCGRVGAAPGCTPRPGPAPGRFGELTLALAHSGGDAQRACPPAGEPRGWWGEGGSPELQRGAHTRGHTQTRGHTCAPVRAHRKLPSARREERAQAGGCARTGRFASLC